MVIKTHYSQQLSVKDPVFSVSPGAYHWSSSQNSQLRRVGNSVSRLYTEMVGRWVRGCLEQEGSTLGHSLRFSQKSIETVINGVCYDTKEDCSFVKATQMGMRRICHFARVEPLQRNALKQLAALQKGTIEDRRCYRDYLQILNMLRRSQCKTSDFALTKNELENHLPRLKARFAVDEIQKGLTDIADIYAKRPLLQRELQSLDAMRAALYALDTLSYSVFIKNTLI
jgi:hypothetical protein